MATAAPRRQKLVHKSSTKCLIKHNASGRYWRRVGNDVELQPLNKADDFFYFDLTEYGIISEEGQSQGQVRILIKFSQASNGGDIQIV